jgi:hypothetical protein
MTQKIAKILFILLVVILKFNNSIVAQSCTSNGLLPQYCPTSPPSTLSGNVPGGYFIGPGMVGSVFTPSLAGPGTHTIQYGLCNSSYSISTLSFSTVAPPLSFTSNISETSITLSDDEVTALPLPIGFTFNFYCNNYTDFYISSNGFITFSSGGGSGCCSGGLLPTGFTPDNLIAAAWEDLFPPAGGTITYTSVGTAPFRQLVVKFANIQHFGGGNPVSFQIVLYETTNLIDIFTLSMPSDGGNHTMGLQNSAASIGHPVSGRNSTSWSVTIPEIQRFTPGNTACSQQVTTISPSTISIVGSNSVCSGSSVNLAVAGNITYTWSTNSNNANISVAPTTNTVYSVSATNSIGCIASSSIGITVFLGNPSNTVTASSNSVCLGGSVSISASGAPTYTFSGGILNGVSFTPSVTTVYTITGGNACGTSISTRTIVVAPLAIIAISSTSVVCSGNTLSLNAGGATSYTWMPGNIIGSNVLISPITSTTYSVSGITGSCTGASNISIAVNPNPTITTVASSSNNICAGSSITLTASGANSYTWQPPVNSVGAIAVVYPTISAAYIVFGTNSFNCTSSTQQVAIIVPSPSISLTTSDDQICIGSTATLLATSNGSILWDFGSTSLIEVVTPTTTTIYTVTASNLNNNCTSSQTISVNVFNQNLILTPSSSICIGNSINISASGAASYLWNTGSINSSFNVTPLVNTSYIVTGATTLTNNVECTSTGTVNISVIPLPTLSVVSTKSIICKGQSNTITVSGASTYTWNTLPVTIANSIVVSPTLATTNYTVSGTSAFGCINTSSIQLKVSACTGIGEFEKGNLFSIFPNPSNGTFIIKSDHLLTLNLVNDLGQLIQVITLNDANNYQQKIIDIANGVYFLNGINDFKSINHKIIISK